MTSKVARPFDSVVLPYHGKLDKSPTWDAWRPWSAVEAGWWYTEDLEEARRELHEQGYIPQVIAPTRPTS